MFDTQYSILASSYITVLIIALPILAMIIAFVFVFSNRDGGLRKENKLLKQKNEELAEELEKAKSRLDNQNKAP